MESEKQWGSASSARYEPSVLGPLVPAASVRQYYARQRA
jgi:hypothetical protein